MAKENNGNGSTVLGFIRELNDDDSLQRGVDGLNFGDGGKNKPSNIGLT